MDPGHRGFVDQPVTRSGAGASGQMSHSILYSRPGQSRDPSFSGDPSLLPAAGLSWLAGPLFWAPAPGLCFAPVGFAPSPLPSGVLACPCPGDNLSVGDTAATSLIGGKVIVPCSICISEAEMMVAGEGSRESPTTSPAPSPAKVGSVHNHRRCGAWRKSRGIAGKDSRGDSRIAQLRFMVGRLKRRGNPGACVQPLGRRDSSHVNVGRGP